MVASLSRSPEADSSTTGAQKQQRAEAYASHHTRHSRYGFSFRETERGARFAAWIGKGKRVLDLGCRDGHLTRCYASDNTVTGVDIDRNALSLARQALGISTVWLDLNREPLPFEDGSFDVVVAGELLEHLVDPEQVVSEASRVLLPDGRFIGSVPNSFHWHARLPFLRDRQCEDSTHLHLFSRSSLLALLAAFGQVKVVPIGGIGGGVIPVLPPWLTLPLVRSLPALFANDFLFCAAQGKPSARLAP